MPEAEGVHFHREEMDAPPGEWLFKVRGEVLGPVPSTELIERMFLGEVNESTLLSQGEGEWVALQSVAGFMPFLIRAKAKIRADRARAEAAAAIRRRQLRARINLSIGAAALVVFGFGATYLLMIFKPEGSAGDWESWSRRHVPLIGVPAAAARENANSLAAADPLGGRINIDRILIDDAPALVGLRSPSGQRVRPASPAKPGGKPSEGQTRSAKDETAAVASSASLSQEEILSEVFARPNLNRMIGCVAQEIQRNADLSSPVQISFTINNDGRVGDVRMLDFRLENGPLHRCLKERLAYLKFRPYNGERRNVELPINFNR